MQDSGMNVTEFLMIVCFVLKLCVFGFGEDENFNARPNHKFSFIVLKSNYMIIFN